MCRVQRFSCKLAALRSAYIMYMYMCMQPLQASCRLVSILDRADWSCDSNSVRSNHSAWSPPRHPGEAPCTNCPIPTPIDGHLKVHSSVHPNGTVKPSHPSCHSIHRCRPTAQRCFTKQLKRFTFSEVCSNFTSVFHKGKFTSEIEFPCYHHCRNRLSGLSE